MCEFIGQCWALSSCCLTSVSDLVLWIHIGSWQSALLTRIFVITAIIMYLQLTVALSLVNSMEEQVISRAHRMGATRPIHVETLAMRGTVEEQMLKLLQVCVHDFFYAKCCQILIVRVYLICMQDSSACKKMMNKGTGSTDNEGGRPHRSLHDFAESSYLAQISSVETGSKATARAY